MINTLFWCVTVPGIYIAGMLLTYKILRKTLFKDDSEREDAIASAMLWVVTVPFMLVCTVPFYLMPAVFDWIDGGDQDG
jgi:hypothetical protein